MGGCSRPAPDTSQPVGDLLIVTLSVPIRVPPIRMTKVDDPDGSSPACAAEWAGSTLTIVAAKRATLRWRASTRMADIAHQYRIITTGAGWTTSSPSGLLRFSGSDALSFLQALVTNDVLPLQPGHGVYAAYLTPQGRMITDMDILHRGDAIFVRVAGALGPTLAGRFDSLIFAENLTVNDVTGEWDEVVVVGGDAAASVAAAIGRSADEVGSLGELQQLDHAHGFVVRGGDSLLPYYRLFVATGRRLSTIRTLEAAGVVSIAPDLELALRIDAGRPRWGVDLTTDTIPLEAGLLDRAISTSKGCYVGQEIVIRILHRGGGRVAKRLATLAFAPGVPEVPAPGTTISVGGHDVGHVTSAVLSPVRNRVVAMGYVHRDVAELGRQVSVAGEIAEISGFAG